MTIKRLFFVPLIVLILITACQGKDTVSKAEATTPMLLLDVTTSAGQAGKYATSRTAESFWLSDGSIIRCFHDNVDGWSNDEITLGGKDCELFTRPSELPQNAILFGINMGTDQKTQSVWGIGDNQLMVCNHSNDWWNGKIDSAESCVSWQRPNQVNSRARLASLNSGQDQEAESFWNNPDGTITECQHKKQGVGFLGLGGLGFGPVKTCFNMPKPQIFPEGKNFVLTGVTSDNYRPMETFWQDDNGVLAQCRHEKASEGWFIFQTYHLGPATDCWYWRAPR